MFFKLNHLIVATSLLLNGNFGSAQVTSKPAHSQNDVAVHKAAALTWLQKSEAAMSRVNQIPPAFHEDIWAHWMVQSYLDLGRPKDAVAFAVRFQQHFDMSFVRSAIRYTSYQLAGEGKFKEAHEIGTLLSTGIAANPHVRQHDVYVDLLIDLAALEARAGDFPRALKSANMIPAQGNSHWAKARADAFGFVALGYARAGDLKGLQAIEREFAPRDNDSLQAARLLLATELAKAGAFSEAEQVAELLPATYRDAFFAGEAVELAMAKKIPEAKAAIAKLPRQDQRDAAWLRVVAVFSFHQGAAAASELVSSNDELQVLGPEILIARALAWSEPSDKMSDEVNQENVFGQVVSSEFDPIESEIQRQFSVHRAFPPHAARHGGDDPFSPPAFLAIDDYDFKPSVEYAQELLGESWNASSLCETLSTLHGSVPEEDFQQQKDRYTALAVVAMIAGDKKQASSFAESAAAAAERLDFRFCGSHTRVLLPTLVQSGRSDVALQYLRRLLAVQTLEQFPAPKIAHALVAAGEESRVEEVLSLVADDSERAAVCLGAARAFIAKSQPSRELPLVRGEWDLLAKLEIRGDESFPRSEWESYRTGYLGSLVHGHPLWLEPMSWPNVPESSTNAALRSTHGEKR